MTMAKIENKKAKIENKKAKIENKKAKITQKKEKILKKKKVLEAITVLKQLNVKFFEALKKQPLLEETTESPVLLQLTLKKIPSKHLQRIVKVQLPHPLTTDTTEVCLITGDLEKDNRKAESEPVVLHYKELLKKHGVTKITEVIPLRQLRTEYKDYEAKRQLVAAYDMFLTDRRIAGCLPKVLGKSFFRKRKLPIQINLMSSNLKEQIERAITKTELFLSCKGNSCTFEVARLCMDDNDIMENILTCTEALADKLPGNWNNVLGAYIKTAKSKSIPIYMSFSNPSEVKMPKRRKNEKVKSEELSTMLNTEVKVFRDGRVIVNKRKMDAETDYKEDESENDVKRIKTDDVLEESFSEEDSSIEFDQDGEESLNESEDDTTDDERQVDIMQSKSKIAHKKGNSNTGEHSFNKKAKGKKIETPEINEVQSKPKRKKSLNKTKMVENSDETVHEVQSKPKRKKSLNKTKMVKNSDESIEQSKKKKVNTKEKITATFEVNAPQSKLKDIESSIETGFTKSAKGKKELLKTKTGSKKGVKNATPNILLKQKRIKNKK